MRACINPCNQIYGTARDEVIIPVHAFVEAPDLIAPRTRRSILAPQAENRDNRRKEFIVLVDTTQEAELLESCFEALTDSIVVFDREKRILLANEADCTMFGLAPRLTRFSRLTLSLPERQLRTVESREDTAVRPSPFDRILCGETLTGKDAVGAVIRGAGGKDVQVSVRGAPIHDDDGNVAGGVAVVQDVAELRQDVRTLGDTVRRMEDALAVAAHDLRNPIAASTGYVQLAAERLRSLLGTLAVECPAAVRRAEEMQAFLNNAERSMRRLNVLVERLLDVARIRADKLDLQSETVDLANIVCVVVHEHQVANPCRNIRYTAPQALAIPIVADQVRIGEVLSNFLANAVQYSPDDTSVEVSLDVDGDEARVSVRDEGVGIPVDARDRVWARFEQIENSAKRATSPGLGIGLYISRTIVEAHGGHVCLDSAPGRGSTFSFVLPLMRQTT